MTNQRGITYIIMSYVAQPRTWTRHLRNPSDEATAHAANTYWASFAKTGDPNSSGLPRWPAYTTASDTILDFTPKGPAAVADPWKTRLDLTEAVVTYKP